MSKYTDAVEHNLRGVFFFSSGAMLGCRECGLEPKHCRPCDGTGRIVGLCGEDELFTDVEVTCTECNGTGEVECSEHDREIADEGGFSWQGCDCCGSPLGGTLYPAHGVPAKSEDEAREKENGIAHYEICTDCVMYIANGDIPDREDAVEAEVVE